MATALEKYINDIRLRNPIPGREWFWKSNAHRNRLLAYALEYEPFTLLLKVGQYARRRQKLAPFTFSRRPTGLHHDPADFKLFRDQRNPNLMQIQTPDDSGQLTPTPDSVQLMRAPSLSSGNRKLVVIHAYFAEEAEQIFQRLLSFTDYDLMLTTSVTAIRDRFLELFEPKRSACFLVPNAGRDVIPLLLLLWFVDLSGYSHFVKVHTKRSRHLTSGATWFSSNVEVLIGQKRMTDDFLQRVNAESTSIFGMDYYPLRGHFWNNRHWLRELNGHRPFARNARFIPGTMFLGSAEFLRRLARLNLHLYHFEPETGQLDGCLVHALERYFGSVAQTNGCVCSSLNSLAK